MKKRRELDALVGGVKPRRKTSNFSKSNTGSSHELLRYNGSDSSDEDYRLHPTKVRNTGLCSTCTSVLIFILLVACLLVCAGLTWMHVEMKKDLEILRKDLQAVDIRSSKSSEDVDKLAPGLQTINKTLHHVISDISAVNNTVTQVSGTIAKLSRSLDAAPELKELPGKLQSVSKVLADLGSDVSGMKDTVESVPPFIKSTSDFLDDLKKQIQEMKEKADKDTSGGREQGSETPDLENLMQTLSQQMLDVNATLSAQFSVLMKASSKHEERLSKLENTSNMLQANMSNLSTHTSSIVPPSDGGSTDAIDYNSDQFQQSVTAVVQQVLSTESQTGKVDAVMANITKVLDSLNELKEKYEDLEETHPSTSTGETTPGSYVTLEMFNTLGEGVTDQISTLNSSFISLKSDVKTMSQILVRHTNTITNLTHHLDATQSYLKHMLEAGSNIPTTVKIEQPSQTLSSNTTPVYLDVTTAPPKQNQESSTSKPTTAQPKSDNTARTISVKTITNFEDLEKNFNRWHRNGPVHYNDLSQYLGDSNMPDEDALKVFDENNDGAYSLAEFAKAFGFDMPTTTTPTETEPPR